MSVRRKRLATFIGEEISPTKRLALSDEAKQDYEHEIKCHSDIDDFLGYCKLDEISYYECLKIKFKTDQKIDTQFILKIYKNINLIIKQIRSYNTIEEKHYFNTVQDILLLIECARYTLTNIKLKKKYDNIIEKKNITKSNTFDHLLENLLTIKNQFEQEFNKLQENIINFTLTQININFSQIYNIQIISQQFIPKLINEILEQKIKQKTIKIIKRPTTMNRLQINWPIPLPGEENMTEEEIKEYIIKPNFLKFGEIKFIYVCPVDKTCTIIEYVNSESVQKAINEINNDRTNRFTVREYSVAHYFNRTLFNTIETKILYLQEDISRLKNNLF